MEITVEPSKISQTVKGGFYYTLNVLSESSIYFA